MQKYNFFPLFTLGIYNFFPHFWGDFCNFSQGGGGLWEWGECINFVGDF